MHDVRVRQRVRHVLADDEVLIASLAGLEPGGRRRRFAALTDARLLVGWLRPAPIEELEPSEVTGGFDRSEGRLTLRWDGGELALRGVDEHAARALLDLLAHRRPRRQDDVGAGPRIRLVRPAS